MYKGVVLAVFHSDNTKGDLVAAANAYIKTYGYLAEWRYQSIIAGEPVSWSDEMRVQTD